MKIARPPFRMRGFTLLELMIGITLLAIVLGMGVPSFVQTVRNNRVTTRVNDLVTALNYARSEAYKRGMAVSVCAANMAVTSCAASTAWSQGWLVFTDSQGTVGTIDADGTAPDDAILDRTSASANTVTHTTTANFVTFQPLGSVTAAQIDIHPSVCSGNEKRRINIATTGRISLTKVGCTA